MKINYPTKPGDVLTIRAEIDGSKIIAHISPAHIVAVGVMDCTLAINVLGVDGHNLFTCESHEDAEQIANNIADCMERARK